MFFGGGGEAALGLAESGEIPEVPEVPEILEIPERPPSTFSCNGVSPLR